MFQRLIQVSILRILKLRVLNRRCTSNLNSTVDKNVYILVYSADGAGNSTYTITCNRDMTMLTNTDLDYCWTILQAWILFGVVCVVFSIVFYKVVRQLTLTNGTKNSITTEKGTKTTRKIETVASKKSRWLRKDH